MRDLIIPYGPKNEIMRPRGSSNSAFRLIGTLRRECLDQTLFWKTADLQAKLSDFQNHFNEYRTHAGLDGRLPTNSRRTGIPDKHCFVSVAEALSRVVPNADLPRNLSIRHELVIFTLGICILGGGAAHVRSFLARVRGDELGAYSIRGGENAPAVRLGFRQSYEPGSPLDLSSFVDNPV